MEKWTFKLRARQISIMPCHFTPSDRTPKSPMYRRLGGAQNQFRCFGKEVNLLQLLEVKLEFICCPACSLIIVLTMLTQLLTVILVQDRALTSCEKHILCSRMPENQTYTPLVIQQINHRLCQSPVTIT